MTKLPLSIVIAASFITEINKLEDDQGLYKVFPPPGTAVVSWHVVMGIGDYYPIVRDKLANEARLSL
jgi:hypothetical protein